MVSNTTCFRLPFHRTQPASAADSGSHFRHPFSSRSLPSLLLRVNQRAWQVASPSLAFAHLASLNPYALPSARPIESPCLNPFLAPDQRGRNEIPRRRNSSWIVLRTKVFTCPMPVRSAMVVLATRSIASRQNPSLAVRRRQFNYPHGTSSY